MPNGGQTGSGSGLQLQSTTPGVPDTGNANVSGTVLSGVMSSPQNPATTCAFGQKVSIFTGNGDAAAGLGCNISLSPRSVAIGYGAFSGRDFISGVRNVVIGNSAKAGRSTGIDTGNCVVIGASASGEIRNSGSSPGNVVIGASASGGQPSLSPSGSPTGNVVIGGSAIATDLLQCTVIGASARARGDGQIIIGNGIDAINTISASKGIVIGDSTHSLVYLGPYILGQSAGNTTKTSDTSVVVQPTQGTVIFTLITAPRTVTLPLANSVPAGYRVTISDFSGNCSAVITITALPSGTNTILYGNPLNNAYDTHEFMSDGVSTWVQTLDTR